MVGAGWETKEGAEAGKDEEEEEAVEEGFARLASTAMFSALRRPSTSDILGRAIVTIGLRLDSEKGGCKACDEAAVGNGGRAKWEGG